MKTTGFSKIVYAYSTDIKKFNHLKIEKHNTDTTLFVPKFNMTTNNNEN